MTLAPIKIHQPSVSQSGMQELLDMVSALMENQPIDPATGHWNGEEQPITHARGLEAFALLQRYQQADQELKAKAAADQSAASTLDPRPSTPTP